ncbi:MAG: HAMP domain-containing histidine kinase [Breznakibacter sp.]|nr:HAMP domain-containing histidine kinase [Breznakibacter sp.]
MKKIYFENKITLAYLLIGSFWILFSDKILHYFVEDATLLTQMQTFKGWFYILITALLLHFFLKNHLEKLRAAQQRALESDKLKTAFIQNISHEVRTPMNGILGFTNLLVKEDITPQERERFSEYVSISTLQLLTIVEEIIELSLIQVGNVEIKESVVNLNDLMEDVLKTNLPQIKREVVLNYKKNPLNTTTSVLLDYDKIKEIFKSLINNANKFSEQGHITFGYSIKNQELEFFVKDSGIGISPEIQQTIFDSFRKSGKSNKLYDGVGLGLSICKGYLQLLNGSIRVESEPNKGSCFYFTVPLKHLH